MPATIAPAGPAKVSADVKIQKLSPAACVCRSSSRPCQRHQEHRPLDAPHLEACYSRGWDGRFSEPKRTRPLPGNDLKLGRARERTATTGTDGASSRHWQEDARSQEAGCSPESNQCCGAGRTLQTGRFQRGRPHHRAAPRNPEQEDQDMVRPQLAEGGAQCRVLRSCDSDVQARRPHAPALDAISMLYGIARRSIIPFPRRRLSTHSSQSTRSSSKRSTRRRASSRTP